jgi:hypothetical protein
MGQEMNRLEQWENSLMAKHLKDLELADREESDDHQSVDNNDDVDFSQMNHDEVRRYFRKSLMKIYGRGKYVDPD